jgi:hypothetical protein
MKQWKSGLGALFAVAMLTGPLDAGPKPFPEFEAKRVKPPKPGEPPRIDVQIVPEEPAAAAEEGATSTETPILGASDWFWQTISPDLTASGPGRLDAALSVISGARTPVPTPRLQDLQDIARRHGVPILLETVGTRISPALVLAVIVVESAGRADALSKKGAQGLMQLMPVTSAQFDVADPMDPGQNIAGGVRYLDWLMDRFGGDPILVLAGYNAGQGAISEHAGVPPFSETRDYVPRVLAAFQVAKGLCKTPPELISDGCVFVGLN